MSAFDIFEMENPPTEVSYHPDIRPFCRIGQAIFDGELYISFRPDKRLLEFESFERWLRKEFDNKPMTIEEAAQRVFSALEEALGDIPLQVTVSARTTVHAPVEAHYSNEKWRKSCESTRGLL